MKIIKIILKILMLILAGVCGMIFSVLFPIIIIASDDFNEYIMSGHPVMYVWLSVGVIGYIIPVTLIMLEKVKLAAVSTTIGTVLTLIVHVMMQDLRNNQVESSAATLYLPQIFMTIFVMIYLGITYIPKLSAYLDKRNDAKNAKSPSVLDSHDE